MTDNLPEKFDQVVHNSDEGLSSILTLFNLIPDPAIIYLPGEDTIIAANNAFFLMTNLGEDDFFHQSIKAVLPNINDTDPIGGHNKKALLRHKKLPLIPVTVRIFPLNPLEKHLVLLLKPDESQPANKSLVSDHSATLEKLISLIQVNNEPNISTQIKNILIQSCELLNTEIACLYKATGSSPPMSNYLSSDDQPALDFPPHLSDQDLYQHQEPELWTSEMPTVSTLHKTAAQMGFQCLVTIPLETNTTKYGLYVTLTKKPLTHPQTLLLANFISVYITNQMEKHNTQVNLRTLANKIKQVVKIQNEIISNLKEGVIILASDLSVAEINPAAETILGYANTEALRQPIESILIGSESLGAAIKSAQQGLPSLISGDLSLHHRSGRSFPAQVLMSPVMRDGKLYSIILLIQDLSQQHQNQAENQQLEQRAILGEVTAIFAHEVRNPINAIMLSLQVMEDNLEEGDPNTKWIRNIRDECNKLMYLMESVLSFAKPLEYKMTGVDLKHLLSSILERWQPRLTRLNITHYFDPELDAPIIEGDLRALEQVFTNLISNSVMAMSEKGGSLGLKITEADQDLEPHTYQITLTDTGHGIPDEIKEHMFKPFVTGSSRGTGLGLAITQRIINAHKGKIEVDSYPGGTIFRIFLHKRKGSNNI